MQCEDNPKVPTGATLHLGDSKEVLPTLPSASIDAVITDPPYELGFMGKKWDSSGIAYDVALWRECLRVLKPGGHLLSFGGSRTYHRMASAIEDAGFEIRDQIMWLYGSGFPKSKNLEGEWDGWGTALKPAHEPLVLARKPLIGTVTENAQKYGVGALNIDGCRVDFQGESDKAAAKPGGALTSRAGALAGQTQAGFVIAGPVNESEQLYWSSQLGWVDQRSATVFSDPSISDPVGATGRLPAGERVAFESTQGEGRWPANVIHDGSEEVLAAFPDAPGQQAKVTGEEPARKTANRYGEFNGGREPAIPRLDSGSAARFFYCAKASRKDRDEGMEGCAKKPLLWSSGSQNPGSFQSPNTERAARNNHPTVKPTELMRYLCRLVTPPGGTVLDPFMGSGSTGKAALKEGFSFIGIEREPEYFEIAQNRIGVKTAMATEIEPGEPPASVDAQLTLSI